eukprot:6214740-Pleurochrysis_carterae.AAC.4
MGWQRTVKSRDRVMKGVKLCERHFSEIFEKKRLAIDAGELFGQITKWSFSSEVRGRTTGTGATDVLAGAAPAGAAPAGVDRVVGPAGAAAEGAVGIADVGAMEKGRIQAWCKVCIS